MVWLMALQTKESNVAQATGSAIAPGRFYSIDEVADYLGVSHRTIRRWIKDGKLRAHRFGRTVRTSCNDLEDFIARHEIRSDGDRRPDSSCRVSRLNSVGKTPNK